MSIRPFSARLPRAFSAIVLGSVLGPGTARVTPAADGDAGPPVWVLAFADEFSGDAIDRRKWNLTDPWEAEKNGELQAYITSAFEVSDGVLGILAERRKAFYDNKIRQYTSGVITTAGKFSQRYGRFAIRCRVPRGRGLWPAFWMLPDPPSWPPEIDILEILGHEPDRVYLTHHWRDPKQPEGGPSKSLVGEWPGPDFSAGFHTFAVEWEPGEIRWLIDGEPRHRTAEHIPDVPMFLLVNLAVGGHWPGNPDETTPFPAQFEIDWVRVWKRG